MAMPAAAHHDDDALDAIRRAALDAKELELVVADLERNLADRKAELSRMLNEVLPTMCLDAKVNGVDVAPEGNLPGFKLKVVPFYRASIPAAWPEDQRTAALEYLEDRGAGDIIKTEVAVAFPKESRDDAKKLIDHLKRWGLSFEVKASVHHSTLSSWLKAEIEGPVRSGEVPFPDLDVIGGSFGKIAKLSETDK